MVKIVLILFSYFAFDLFALDFESSKKFYDLNCSEQLKLVSVIKVTISLISC
jgi:hypothetical protein